MIKRFKHIFFRISVVFLNKYDRILIYLIYVIGFSSVANSNNTIQPEYGVRIVPDYGPPVNTMQEILKGSVFSSNNSKPLKNIKIKLISQSVTLDSATTNSSGKYQINYTYDNFLNEKVCYKISVIPNSDNINLKYLQKDSIVMLPYDIKSYETIINFYLDEKE